MFLIFYLIFIWWTFENRLKQRHIVVCISSDSNTDSATYLLAGQCWWAALLAAPAQSLTGLILCVCSTDTERELEIVREKALEAGAFDAVVCDHWARGGAGATLLAEAVVAASKQPSHFQFLYDLDVCICF